MQTKFKIYLEQDNITIEKMEIEKHDIIRLTNKSKHTELVASQALKNIVVPFRNFPAFNLNTDKDWDTRNDNYGDSYQLYIHSLRFVNELLTLYDETQDIKLLNKARDYIMGWISFASENEGSTMVWYDHPTAQRIQVIIYYLYLAEKKHQINYTLFFKTLKYHSKFLSSNDNYRRNNHGLMMDRSLMILGNILNDKEIFNIGYYRSIDTFWHSFSYTGMHLENSPEYHVMVTNMYIELQKYLSKTGSSYSPTIISYLNKANRLKEIFVRPDNLLPAIGDTGIIKLKVNKKYENFVDYESGFSIIQDEKNKLFLTFISGYATVTHKHIDDLSFSLIYKGKDFIVDPGKFSYSKHPYRRYIKSYEGHSGIYINHKNYEIKDENRLQKSVFYQHHFENEDYMLIKGINNSYEEGNLSRTIIYIKKEQVILFIDTILAKETLEGVHIFNLHHNVKITKVDDFKYMLKHDDTELELKNHSKNNEFTILRGNKEKKPYHGLNSVVFNEVVDTSQVKTIEFVESNNSSTTIYSISEKSLSYSVNLESDNKLQINFTNKNYTLYI